MPRGRNKNDEIMELKESLKQNWLQNSYQKTYEDQFGFRIEYGKEYKLFYRNQELMSLRSLPAAKLISTIILNDKIMNPKE